MKILKSSEHAPLFKPFGLYGKLYLAVTVLTYFDLTAPESLLSESELWKNIPDQLGRFGVLDFGMPKPRAEFLVYGACRPLGGAPCAALQVRARVGGCQKVIDVFGDRYWIDAPSSKEEQARSQAGRLSRISDPLPFTVMPLTWERAFGGKEYAKNPLGVGAGVVTTKEGRALYPLPNLEQPEHLVGDPTDRPEPASFGPLDMMWPQRAALRGTYDDAWLKERWPYFPDDLNPEFFNTAPADQRFQDLLRGDETIEIEGMHPQFARIDSRLPPTRIRAFVTKSQNLKDHSDEHLVFENVDMRPDTVTLFPDILRGVVAYRGMTELLDDEYADVRYVYLASERLADAPLSLDHYQEQQRLALDRSVPVRIDVAAQVKKKVDRAMLHFRVIPSLIKEMQQIAMQKVPPAPPNPDLMEATVANVVQKSRATLDAGEKTALALQAKFGHLVEIDLTQFDRMRASIDGMAARSATGLADLRAAKASLDASAADVKKQVKLQTKPEMLLQAGLNPETLEPLGKTPALWPTAAMEFAMDCRIELERRPEVLSMVEAMGLSRPTMNRLWLGYNPSPRVEDPARWGLSEPFTIPDGLVMSRVLESGIVRLTVFPGCPQPEVVVPYPYVVPGSEIGAMLFMLREASPVICVPTRLEGQIVVQELIDLAAVLVMSDPDEPLLPEDAAQLAMAPLMLILRPEGFMASPERLQQWRKIHPKADFLNLPRGISTLQAKKYGYFLRDWVLDHIPRPMLGLPAYDDEVSAEEAIAQTVKFSIPDIKGLVTQAIEETRAFHTAAIQKQVASTQPLQDLVKQTLAKKGHDMDALLAKATPLEKPATIADASQKLLKEMAARKKGLAAAGLLTPELATRMDEAAATLKSTAAMGEGLLADGLERIAAGEAEIEAAMERVESMAVSPEMGDKLREHGLDPDKARLLTREQALERIANGRELSQAILKKLDFSGLDLQGVDFSGAIIEKVCFAGAQLQRANFSRTILRACECSGADFSASVWEMSLADKSTFAKAKFTGARLKQALFANADLSETDWTGAVLKLSIFKKASLRGAVFHKAEISLTAMDGEAQGLNCVETRFERCILRDMALDKANFARATLASTLLHDAHGEGVSFAGADLSKLRMGGKCAFPAADFRNIVMRHGCLRQADLNRCVFHGANIDSSMFEDCDLTQVDMGWIKALRTRFLKSSLEGANLRCINLSNGSLRKSRLIDADLSYANLLGVDVYKMVVGRTRFDGAVLTRTLLEKRSEFLS